MKKIFLPLAVAALAAWAAPEAAAQLSVGGGYANLMLNQVLQDNQTKAAEVYNGFHITADLMLPIYGPIAFYPGVSFTIAMNKQDVLLRNPENRTTTLPGRQSNKLSYLHVPLRVAYSVDLGKVQAAAFVGPSLDWGFDGEHVLSSDAAELRQPSAFSTDPDGKVPFSYTIWPFKNQAADGGAPEGPYLKNLDVKLGFGVVVDLFEHIRVSASYDLGLMNIVGPHYDYGVDDGGVANDPEAPRSIKGNLFQVGIAYVF